MTTQEIKDALAAGYDAELDALKEQPIEASTKPTVEFVDIENYGDDLMDRRNKGINKEGGFFVNIYEGQKMPLNIGLQVYQDKPKKSTGELEYYNAVARQTDTVVNKGDEIIFTAFARDSGALNSIGKYKIYNVTTGRQYPLQWFSKSIDPRVALKEVQDRLLDNNNQSKPTVTTKETTPNIEDWSKDVESTAKALEGVSKNKKTAATETNTRVADNEIFGIDRRKK